jgi:ubiquinone/menaquinone biosynthesis C-methylase UbiE
MNDSTQRFSRRVEAYVKYRPGYPSALLSFLKDECQLKSDSIIADVGSGTGLLTELFLRNGNCVYGIEPNREMREAAERLLESFSQFHSIDASAESTTLCSQSVDFVTVGRAFHWFDHDKALSEFSRILKPEGWVVVVWLKRKQSTSFLVEYEELLWTYAKDYREMKQKRLDSETLLRRRAFKWKILEDERVLDFESLKGQTLSYSVTPEAGDSNYVLMQDALSTLFQRHQQNGTVVFNYDLLIYYGNALLATELTPIHSKPQASNS